MGNQPSVESEPPRTPLRQTCFGRKFLYFLRQQLDKKGYMVLVRLHQFCVIKWDFDMLGEAAGLETDEQFVELILRVLDEDRKEELMEWMRKERGIFVKCSPFKLYGSNLRF